LQAYLHILLVHIQRLAMALHPDPPLTASVAIVREFRRLVSLHSATERSIRVYAQEIGITTSHLCDTVKAVTGFTPGQILRQTVVLEAKRLLANTDLTVAEIGYRLNFKDPAYFGRFFRREAHTSPSAFRQEIRIKYHVLPK
jgi:AraC-like DNA-binding protein